jgi:putative polyketide hydroxylase
MELFRQWGNAAELSQWELPKEARRIIWAHSLRGEEVTRVSMDDSATSLFSPAQASLVSQDRVEESLYHSLLNYKQADVQFLKECVSFEENENGIIAKILDRTNHHEQLIHASYLIAADGAHSRIRQQLKIEMNGPDNLGQFCNVYCEFDITQWTKDRPFIGMFFTDPTLSGRLIATVNGTNRWIVGIRFAPGNTKEHFSDEYCINEIRRITGIPDLSINIINKNFWTMAAQTANQYRKGCIFLVGDAAHRLPPTGGFGMNTGIQDAHNLAWKLALVINHNISDTLLDTYYAERAPVAERNVKWSTENATRYVEINKAIHADDTETLKLKLHEQQKNLNYTGLDLGFIYHSDAVISENDLQLSVTPSEYVPTTLPGSRAPHVKLMQNGNVISTLDLFEKDFVLLVGEKGQAWQEAATELSMHLPLKVYRVAVDGDLIDTDNKWLSRYQITNTGAVLVRPDGHVAWRSVGMLDKPQLALENCFKRYLYSEIGNFYPCYDRSKLLHWH